MVEALMTKAVIVHEPKAGMVLYGEYCMGGDDIVNFRVPYVWEEVDDDHDEFFSALRETIAEKYDVAVKFIDVPEEELLKRMAYYSKQANIGGLLH